MFIVKSIGQTIKTLRRERNLTQEELAEHINVTSQAVSKWENDVGLPDISQVVPLAHFFGVSMDILFGIKSCDELDEIGEIIKKATAQETYRSEYSIIKEALGNYPGDTRLLSELLSCGVCLLSNNEITPDEKQTVFAECERAGKLILSYSKDIAVLVETSQWLVRLYCETENIDKAVETAENLPYNITFNKNEALARIDECLHRYSDAKAEYEQNIIKHSTALLHSYVMFGNMFLQTGEKNKVIAVYKRIAELGESFVKDDLIKWKDCNIKNITDTVNRCKKQIVNITSDG